MQVQQKPVKAASIVLNIILVICAVIALKGFSDIIPACTVVMAINHHNFIQGVDRASVQLISMNLLPGTLQMGQVSGMAFSTVLPQTGQM